MKNFGNALVVTHVAYRTDLSPNPVEGPYIFLETSLNRIVKRLCVLRIPLVGFERELVFGEARNLKRFQIPSFLGKLSFIKYFLDGLIIFIIVFIWCIKNNKRKNLIVGIDPLSCLPLLLLKPIFKFTLVFHCVDFNKSRFSNLVLQKLYELADKWATKYSDQTWVVCDTLVNYKRTEFGVESYYFPNSVVYDAGIYKNGKDLRIGNKMVWTGSLMTNRQFDILFNTLSIIQKSTRSDIEFVLAPTRDHEKFQNYVKKFKLKKVKILHLKSRLEFQKVASTCDVGIALYDERFGSTEFIEPMKMWDFLLCGLPFIVSKEPSINSTVKKLGVAYFLGKGNKIDDFDGLKNFLRKDNLSIYSKKCLLVAKQFDLNKQVDERIKVLLSEQGGK